MLDWLKSVDKIEKASSAVKWFFVTLIRCIVMVSVVLVMMIIAEFVLCCDYGAAGVGCIVMMYLLSSNRDVAFAVAVILLGLFSGTIEFFALFMLIPLRYYNGKKRHFTKLCLLRLLPGASFCTVPDMQACYGCCSHLTE